MLVSETPALTIRRDAHELVLTWPAPSPGWELHASSDLANWTRLTITPTLVDGNNEWRVSVSQAERYYRLKKP